MISNEKDKRKYRYVKFGNGSGCVSANYGMNNTNSEMIIVPYENHEISGDFNPPCNKN